MLQAGQFALKDTTPYPRSATSVLERQGGLQSGWSYKLVGGKMRGMTLESPDHLPISLEPSPVVLASADSLRTAQVTAEALTKEYQQLTKLLKTVAASSQGLAGNEQAAFEDARRTENNTALAFIKAHTSGSVWRRYR
jgi:hypothetical protein